MRPGRLIRPDGPVPYAPANEAMHRLADDRAERATRAAAGVERARRFTWARCAEETERVYRIALAQR